MASTQNDASRAAAHARPQAGGAWRAAASLGGVGFLPWAPGTWATLVALGPAYLLRDLTFESFSICILLASVLAVLSAQRAADAAGSSDPQWVVIDEAVGTWVALSCCDRGCALSLLLGAFLFRFFDIVKPWPVRALERRVGGGPGIVLDDVAAGVLAAGALALFSRWA
jgi:phosphatidylglycerophosphatase A